MGKKLDGETPYLIMFGPDICGGKKKVHVIVWHNGTNHMINEDIRCKTDELTHVYTLLITPANQYKVYSLSTVPLRHKEELTRVRFLSIWRK